MAIKFLNTVAVDTNVLFVDTTNNRVGINTASPARALQVGDGSTDESIGVYYNDNSYMRLHGYGLYMSRTSSYIRPVTTTTQSLFVGSSSQIWNAIANNANTHYFQKGADEWMRITSTGRVGIGTTSPLVELEVDGSIMASSSSGGALRLNADSASNSGVRNSILSTTQNGLAPPQGELKWEAGQYGGASVWTTRLHTAPYTASYINLPHTSTGGNFVVNIESVDRLTIDRTNGNVSIGSLNVGALHTNYSGADFNTNLGFENFNNGFAALATGQLTLADAALSTSMGYQCKALGVASLAGGNTNPNPSTITEAAGEASVAFGNGVKTSSNAKYSQAFGRGTVTGGGNITANQAMAIGYQNTAWADNSFAGGNDSNAFGEESFAFGAGATASKGDSNIALGLGITTNTSATAAIGAGQVAVGKYNNFSSGIAHNFAVGTGQGDTMRTTGFCVTNVGYTGIGVENPGSKLDILSATNTTASALLRLRTTNNPSSAPEKVVGFYANTTTEKGYIGVNQYAVIYSTSSDYRLKENIVPISNSIERLKELKPCRFNFIEGDPNYVVDGFIAHEAAEVVPEAVTGEKDAVDEDNNPSYQGIDQSKVVPLLTAALQEAISKIEQLETRIQTLENN